MMFENGKIHREHGAIDLRDDGLRMLEEKNIQMRPEIVNSMEKINNTEVFK
jgi:hypothetical protein